MDSTFAGVYLPIIFEWTRMIQGAQRLIWMA